METIQACVNQRLLTKADRLFTGTLDGRIIELLQNARRAGATKVTITNDGGWVTVRDNGQGIKEFAKLLDLGGSGWDEACEKSEDPAGVYGGTIEINGIDIRELYRDRFRVITEVSRQFRVAYVFQKGGLFDSMNVFDNVAFGLRRMNIGEDSIETMVVNSLARVGLKGSEGKLISELSGGMQKRVGLARAICLDPNVIFFDDPTAGLDPILSDSIADLILEIKSSLNTTSIVVTHDATVARKVGDSIALLYNGRIVHEGNSDAFFSGSDTYARQFLEGDIEGPIDIF